MNYEQIIKDYGRIIELTLDHTATSENFLPHSKDDIKSALLLAHSKESDKKQSEALMHAYIRLAAFIPEREAIIVRRYEEYIKALANKEQIKYSDDSGLAKEYSEIQRKIAQNTELLLKQINV